ncbi:MAG TPA: PAS domain S-box protein [Bacteroidia bacterium]|jgi:PAS domain S-box-containing protein|nr:PAS domain S-box protein [Bacteroidia bacterium]
MRKLFSFKWFRNVSIAKKLYFTVGIMALLIALELFTLWFAISTLSSVRAYVGGEGLWSKAQKDAIYHLERYGHTRDENDYNDFLKFMEVPIGDHKARLELSKANPDYNIARQGFIEGRNDPQDVDGMINLFRRFHGISYISKAIVIWTQADSISEYLLPLGERLHKEITSPLPSDSFIDATLQAITPVNYRLTVLEDDFSFTLGEGSRWLENLILKLLFGIALTVEISGLLLTISVSKGIQKGLTEVLSASEKISKGDLTVRAKKFSQDEIGILADSFNKMTEELIRNTQEKKESRKLLKESEESFRLLIENVRDYAIFMMNPSGYIISWNEGAERITGYSYNETIGKHISIFYTPEQLERNEPEFNLNNTRSKGTYQCEGWRIRKDGTLFLADIVYTSLYDDDDKLSGYAKIIRDVTERKRFENNLFQSRTQLANAQQLAHIGSWEWDLVNNTLDWSDEMYRIHGLDPNGPLITPEKAAAMMHPGEKDFIAEVVQEAKANHRNFDFNHRIIRTDNSIRTLHARGEVVLDPSGKPIKMVGTDQDISDRLQEEEMEKLAMAATKSNNSVLIADRNGEIKWVNEGFTKLTGYTIDDLKNTNGDILRHTSPAGTDSNREHFEAVLRDKKPAVYESRNFTKDGKEYWAITTLSPMIGKDGEVERIIAIDSDITERKQIEKDLILANQIAEHSLKKGNKALNELMKAKKDLEESMRVKEQFLAKMSHEIRTPMNAILGLTEILLDGDTNQDQKECLDAIKLSSDNLLSIINDILDFSKLESGKVNVEKVPFSPNEVIDGVLLTMGVTASAKNVQLFFSPGKKPIPSSVIGDPVRLRQILLNLCSNSVKFTEKGSVEISAEMVSEDEEKYELKFTVKDTGIGIPSDRLGTIFESFTQASNETSRKYGGTGLGLTIVKQLTELMGGTVTVESELDHGSVFTILLPFGKTTTLTDNGVGIKKDLSLENISNVHILLAEDNEMNQMLATKVFEKWKVHLDIAYNGKEAITKMEASDYDVVLMDIQMPEMDGYEATNYIRTKLAYPKNEVPIIAMTAHAIVGEAEKCIAKGMNDYISKPFNRNTLLEKIVHVLQDKKTPLTHPSPEKRQAMETPTVSDLSYLEQIAEGNHDFMIKMIRSFMKQTPQILEQMEKSLGENKWNEISGMAHKLKPSLEFVGIHSLKKTVAELEKIAGAGQDLDRIPGMITSIRTICEQAMKELNLKLSEYQSV